MNFAYIWLGKLISLLSQKFGGAGSTWPGHIVLTLNPKFIRNFRKKFKGKVILIAGTNGKTTTCKLIRTILEADGRKVIHNEAGANLLNGIASGIITRNSASDLAIFEVDENTLPIAVGQLKPDILVLLNLFRDQLDRYGEVDTIAKKWKGTLKKLNKKTTLILNADDPYVTFLGKNLTGKVLYFGIENKKLFLKNPQHAMDTIYCPNCTSKISFSGIYFSHLGRWECKSCGLIRPKIELINMDSPLPGIYNIYNTQAAILVAQALGISPQLAKKTLVNFAPAFGRQEEFNINGKKVKIFLSKNPAGFNESIRTVKNLGAKTVLLVLNDRIPDGRDVSWIWDVDTEELVDNKINVVVSGDRTYDMALRIKYSTESQTSNLKSQKYNLKLKILENLKEAIQVGLKQINKGETLYILPTYSAMLEVRKILIGRKIL